jgi:tRNA(Ile)-lysidine synthetase-like protein
MKSTEKSSPFEAKVYRLLRKAGPPPGAGLVVGISGGPDSTALLAALVAVCSGGRFGLTACIVDHGIRPREEREGDAAFARELASSLDVPLKAFSVPEGECAALARRRRGSLEEAARELRHGLLRRVAMELGAWGIALGHTRDDQVETILMRVLQGSGTRGLSGIALKRGLFVHPLLFAGRKEVLSYLESKGLAYRVDSTNSDVNILRNRLRSELIPALERTLPGFGKGLLSMAQKMAFFDDYIEGEASSRLSWQREREGFSIGLEDFFSAPPALRACSLFSLYDRTRAPGHPRRLPFRFLLPVLGEKAPEGPVLLRGNAVSLRRQGGSLHWGRDIVTYCEKSYFIAVETDGSHAISGAEVRVRRGRAERKSGTDGVEVYARGVVTPLVLRSKRRGDEISLPCGRKSVKDLFIEWKVPPEERAAIPVLADRLGLVAVLGSVRGFPTRVRADEPDRDGGTDITVSILRTDDEITR